MLKKYFPTSNRATDVVGLIVALLIYIVAPAVVALIANLLSGVPIIGWLLGIVSGLAGLYCLIGIIVSILVFLKVIK